ncbi:MAG: hypothetical protein ABIP79_01450 [Chitinophagaceae bacterium]
MKIQKGTGFIVGLFLITIFLISAFIILFSYSGYSFSYENKGMLQDSTSIVNQMTVK